MDKDIEQAARAMLAALQAIAAAAPEAAPIDGTWDEAWDAYEDGKKQGRFALAQMARAAIATAEAAGITAEPSAPTVPADPPTYATPEQITAARAMYQTDDIEIDDMDVKTSRGDDAGTWIAAWVWLPDADTVEA